VLPCVTHYRDSSRYLVHATLLTSLPSPFPSALFSPTPAELEHFRAGTGSPPCCRQLSRAGRGCMVCTTCITGAVTNHVWSTVDLLHTCPSVSSSIRGIVRLLAACCPRSLSILGSGTYLFYQLCISAMNTSDPTSSYTLAFPRGRSTLRRALAGIINNFPCHRFCQAGVSRVTLASHASSTRRHQPTFSAR